MGHHKTLAAALLALAAGASAQTVPDWENPQVLGINKLPYHSTHTLPSRQAECPEVTPLDGSWRFCWSPDPASRPAGFQSEDYDVSGWPTIIVPGNWQLQGFGRPIYTNISFPFKADQPRVTSEPPCRSTPSTATCPTHTVSCSNSDKAKRPACPGCPCHFSRPKHRR